MNPDTTDGGIDTSLSTRRRFLGVVAGVPIAALVAPAWAGRQLAGSVSRPPLAPSSPPKHAGDTQASGNLLSNTSFELDQFGTTITSWVVGPTLATCASSGIPASL